MLTLRILLMMLTIICLMDGHKEVMSARTGTKHQKEASDVQEKPEPEQNKIENGSPQTGSQNKTLDSLEINSNSPTLDRKKKKSKPKKKKGKRKPNRPTKNKPNKLIRKTTKKPAPATTTSTTTTTTTTSTVATSSTVTTATSTPTTSTTTSAVPGECKTTGGSPCIFPFKDGGKEYNECADQAGRYYWCATKLRPSGYQLYWSYCPTDGSCPLEKPEPEGCKAIDNKPCKFPFKDGNKEYNECADFRGSYFWCATTTSSDGIFTSWEVCKTDGSCPLEGQTTVPSIPSIPTTISTILPTTGTSAVPNEIENKVYDTLQNLALGESRSSSSQIFNLLDKKLETIIEDIEGKPETRDQISSGAIDVFEKKLSANKELTPNANMGQEATDGNVGKGRTYEDGWMFVLSTVDAMKSVKKGSGDCCTECRFRYTGIELAEYWKTFNICYCYKRIEGVEPMIRSSSEFASSDCGEPTNCCSCNAKRETKIVNGIEANINEHPWMVYVYTPGGGFGGGSLISKRWVLTAAHCSAATHVALGLHDKKYLDDAGTFTVKREIQYKFQPSNYLAPADGGTCKVPGNLAEDILLVYMNKEVLFTELIQPINIFDFTFASVAYAKPHPFTFTLYGWGYQKYVYPDGSKEAADVLRKVNLKIMNVEHCVNTMDVSLVKSWYQKYLEDYDPVVDTNGNENGFVKMWKFCAESASEPVGAGCYGDSGSPLVVWIEDEPYVLGVLSHGTDCASINRPPPYCELPKSTVFTNVQYYANVIKDIIKS